MAQAALQGGIAKNGTVDLYGPLDEFPFVDQKDKGYIFKITGMAEDVKLDYVPVTKKIKTANGYRASGHF